MVKRLPEFHHWDHYLFDVNHPNAWNNAGLVWRVSRPKLWSLSSKWCCLGFPRWWRKTRFPNGFPYWMDGWSLILGHWGYVNAYVLLNLWFFHAWLIGWFILAFFVFLETVDVLLRFPSWIFLNFYLICTFDRHFLLKPVKDKKCDGFFSLQDFQLQLLQLRSVSWYFPTKKRDFFLSATIFVVGFKSQTSGKTLGNSSWVFCSLVVFFWGGMTNFHQPPPFPACFWSPKKKQLGKIFVLWKFRQDHRKKLAAEISPVNLGGESLPCWGWVWWKGNRSSVVCHDGVSGLVSVFQSIQGWLWMFEKTRPGSQIFKDDAIELCPSKHDHNINFQTMNACFLFGVLSFPGRKK